MCGVVTDNLMMVFGSGGAPSVIRRLGRYTDGIFWCCIMRGVSGGNVDITLCTILILLFY
jgi:hypothetical protein